MFDKNFNAVMTGTSVPQEPLTEQNLKDAWEYIEKHSAPRPRILYTSGYGGIGFAKEVSMALGSWSEIEEIPNLKPDELLICHENTLYKLTRTLWLELIESLPISEEDKGSLNIFW